MANEKLKIATATTVDAAEMMNEPWIPVTERLPENGVRVLVAYRNGDVRTGVSFSGFLALSYGPDAWTDATHWLPLPEAPKEVQKDG